MAYSKNIHSGRARVKSSRRATSKSASRKNFVFGKRAVMTIIVVAMMTVILAVLFSIFATPERTITKKIDQRVEERPELESQVKDFREKYYPEVVRLTDEYNEKIEGIGKYESERAADPLEINANPNYLEEQAAEIKVQLISLIDSVAEASENLLEKLHEDDIMDISTDIKMLQTTLASKGLLDSDFDL
jgi:uncharacterized coiled-coil DUF342 family protein